MPRHERTLSVRFTASQTGRIIFHSSLVAYVSPLVSRRDPQRIVTGKGLPFVARLPFVPVAPSPREKHQVFKSSLINWLRTNGGLLAELDNRAFQRILQL